MVSAPDLAPPRMFGGIAAVWIFGGLVSVVAGILAPEGVRAIWLSLGLGGCLILAFVVQLSNGWSRGFIRRVAVSVLGALFVMSFISVGFGLSTLIAI